MGNLSKRAHRDSLRPTQYQSPTVLVQNLHWCFEDSPLSPPLILGHRSHSGNVPHCLWSAVEVEGGSRLVPEKAVVPSEETILPYLSHTPPTQTVGYGDKKGISYVHKGAAFAYE